METKNINQLLRIDLFGRLPYGIFVKDARDDKSVYTCLYHPDIDTCKPYLRSKVSMTDDERNKYLSTCRGGNIAFPTKDSFDYLDSIYVDYRGLIESGIALEAPEGMYT